MFKTQYVEKLYPQTGNHKTMEENHQKNVKRSSQYHRRRTLKNVNKSERKPDEREDSSSKKQDTSKVTRKVNIVKNKSNRSRRRDRSGKKDEIVGVKLVLRLLPPNLTKEQFTATLEPVMANFAQNHVVDWYYVQGHYSSKFYAEPVYSRCYFVFETMEHLKDFVAKVRPIKFVDDKDNTTRAVIKVSPHVKKLTISSKKPARSSQALEGTLEEDDLFQTFMKSLKLLEEKNSEYSFANISILKPLEKELAKQKGIESAIQKKTEMALIELTGDNDKKSKEKEKRDKKKNKKKKGRSELEEVGPSPTTDIAASQKRKRSKKKNKGTSTKNNEAKSNDAEKNNNVVILEAAGKRELQRRNKLLKDKEKELEIKADPSKPNSKRKPRSKGKSKEEKIEQSANSQNSAKPKILKRDAVEQS